MNLIEINGYYINTDRIDVIRPHRFDDTRGNIYHSTHIFIGGNKTPFEIYKPIEEVVAILKGE
jgi:hypothetical protein